MDISDALSEKDKVKFTVHTRTGMAEFAKTEFSVIRLHEVAAWHLAIIWLLSPVTCRLAFLT